MYTYNTVTNMNIYLFIYYILFNFFFFNQLAESCLPYLFIVNFEDIT